ncbi:MAG TPA: glycosyltransferase [Solirubrobacterales bacterium]|nr:glycosyltransferase [Solirubrobacterales bacterium]
MARSIFFYTDSPVLGGAENAMLMLLESLDREEWEPTLLLDDRPGAEVLAGRAAALGVPVRLVGPLPLGLGGAREVPALARLLRHERPEVFHAHMSSPVACKWGLAAAVAARVPAVLGTVQVGGYEPPDRSAYWQLRGLARGVDRYLAVSREIAGELVEGLGWPAEKIEVVYNAVDLARVEVEAPPGLREQLGGSETRALVLTPARLDAQKGHDVLLEAMPQVPDATFLFAGEGPERERLETLAAQLGIADRVRFLGRREDVPQLLAACDVFALPSLYEGSSLAVLEAMAAGIPIVSSAIGGTEELIEDGRSGLLVKPGDSEALAAALRRALGDPELRKSLTARARERVEAGLTREAMASRVEGVYRELLGAAPSADEALPEARRNPMLRRQDWRFALPDAELVESWKLPLPGRAQRAQRRAEAAGFEDVRLLWPGPLPHRLPQFWLPLESDEASEYLLATRAADSLGAKVLQGAWRLARGAGLLAPLYLVGRRRNGGEGGDVALSPAAPLLLLTGGRRSINKVVGLAFEGAEPKPSAAVKFARVPEAEPGLEREAQVLRRLGEERPDFAGAPRLRSEGRRAGRLAVVEDVVEGNTLLDQLTPQNFEPVARQVTRLLIDLAGSRQPQGARWIAGALAEFETQFGSVVGEAAVASVRGQVAGLGDLPTVPEHRDCSPWNVVITPAGDPVLLDWESAEADGLPGLDLFYFLANCAFVLDGALESGRTRESYARLLDPTSPYGRIYRRAVSEYATALGIASDDLDRLRLLCWIVHSRSDYRHAALETGGAPRPEDLRRGMFLGLVEEELR